MLFVLYLQREHCLTSMLTFFDQLTQHAILRPEHTAIVTDSYSLNYAELLRRVEAGHSYLRTIGVGPEARVGVSISDEVEHLLASLSLLATGAGQIILATHDSQSLKSSLSQRLRITHVLSTNEKYKVEDAAFMSWPEQKSTRAAKSILKPSVSSATLYLRTSGTTGDSNLVPLSEEQIALQSEQHPEYALILRNTTYSYLAEYRTTQYLYYLKLNPVHPVHHVKMKAVYLLLLHKK